MSTPKRGPAELLRTARQAKENGDHFLTLGASVGAIGLAGAALGAVCPLCVVATPAFLGLGVVQLIRGLVLSSRAKSGAAVALGANPADDERLIDAVAGVDAAPLLPHT
jgi:hypothetical protein